MQIKIDSEFKALIPPLKADEYAQLEANILADGCRDALVVWDGVLIDGHNRFEICTRHGIEFDTVEMAFDSAAHARVWMRSNQAGRRNLPDAWRIELQLGNKADLAAIGRQKYKDTVGRPSNEIVVTNDHELPKHNTKKIIAEAAGVSTGQIAKAEIVKREAPELWEKAKSQEITIGAAYKEVKNEEKKTTRAALIQNQRVAIESGKADMPEGIYEVVVIDPPWNYGREYDPDSSRVANPYPEMTQDELLALQPPFADDCVLFLWTTHQFIWDAKVLMDRWGFNYKATIVWDKERLGMGRYFRMQCEFALVGIKGKPAWENTKWRDIIKEPRREHSRKPESFYEMVESITVGRRLDFFSRETRNGWKVFGNDTEKF